MAGPAVSPDEPILTAKITAPLVPDWAVQRPRITKLIADGTRWCPLTVVTGPPGAGKTMALAVWAAAEPGIAAWASLDEFDNQPEAFWSYVIAALRRAGVDVPAGVTTTTPGWATDHRYLLRLVAALAAQDPPVTLVLDDLHLMTEPAVLNGLDFLLRNVGPGLRLLVSSRMDPLLPLHRYRLAGQLAEIRASDLAFTTAEAGQLLAQHGHTLPPDWLERLTQRTEGWAAGLLALAAISMGTHPDPDLFVTELITEGSALTSYLVEEVLNAQPPVCRELLLSTSILEDVSAEAASELTGDEQAAVILPVLARTNAFIQPIGRGRYRYHILFGEVLRLKLRSRHPDRVALLHRRAAQWYGRNGQLDTAVRHAIDAGDWQLAASMVIDELAIGEITERDSHYLADEFHNMPRGQAWSVPQPYLVTAAVALSTGREESAIAALHAAEGILERLAADEQAPSRLAAAMIRLAASLRAGDVNAAAAAAAQAEILISRVPRDKHARHPEIRARVLADRGVAELWSGRLDEASHLLDLAVGAVTGPVGERERAHCLGYLALVEALRGRLRRAAKLAAQVTAAHADRERPPAQHPNPAALVALAWVHLERNELRETHRRLKQADAALAVSPDQLIGAMACLAAAGAILADGRAAAAVQIIARARSGWSWPAWLDHRLSLTESQAHVMAGDIQAALAAAEHGGHGSLAAAAAIAHVWMAAGNRHNAGRALASVLTTENQAPERVRLQAWLVDAQLSYSSSDRARGHRSLASALRLAQREQLRLPFAIERCWIEPVLRRDPVLAGAHQRLFAPAPRLTQLPGAPALRDQATALAIQPLTEREREVLRHVARLLGTAEIAREMYISINTVKSHMKSILRKLAATRRSDAVRRARELQLI